jgi:hypothetical protein
MSEMPGAAAAAATAGATAWEGKAADSCDAGPLRKATCFLSLAEVAQCATVFKREVCAMPERAVFSDFGLVSMRRGHGPDIGALMLAMQVMRIGVENIGAVTMAVLGINSILFFYDLDLPFSTADGDVCIGAAQVWYGGQFRRLLLHAFFHANSAHLYANMSSLLLKGRLLESAFGTRAFAWLIFSFTITTGAVLTILSLVRLVCFLVGLCC